MHIQNIIAKTVKRQRHISCSLLFTCNKLSFYFFVFPSQVQFIMAFPFCLNNTLTQQCITNIISTNSFVLLYPQVLFNAIPVQYYMLICLSYGYFIPNQLINLGFYISYALVFLSKVSPPLFRINEAFCICNVFIKHIPCAFHIRYFLNVYQVT